MNTDTETSPPAAVTITVFPPTWGSRWARGAKRFLLLGFAMAVAAALFYVCVIIALESIDHGLADGLRLALERLSSAGLLVPQVTITLVTGLAAASYGLFAELFFQPDWRLELLPDEEAVFYSPAAETSGLRFQQPEVDGVSRKGRQLHWTFTGRRASVLSAVIVTRFQDVPSAEAALESINAWHAREIAVAEVANADGADHED